MVTVGTSTNDDGTSYGYMRKGFYAAGLFWAFYSNGTNAGWEFTANPAVWAGAFTSIGPCTRGYYFSIWFDEATGFVHYVRHDYGGTWDLYYRRGTPENDGSITWSAAEQTVDAGISTDRYSIPCICVDTNGFAWIGATHTLGTVDHPYALKNDNNDGTWALDFAYLLWAYDAYWKVYPIPLTGGKVYVVHCNGIGPYGKLYDAGWSGRENFGDGEPSFSGHISAVADGDDVHFVYHRIIVNDIRYSKRAFGVGWGAEVVVQTGQTHKCGPALSIDTVTGDLYCFWTRGYLVVDDHVYYKKYSSGSWDADPTDWIDESADGIKEDEYISVFSQTYSDYIGVLYGTKTGSPYNVKFAFLTMPPQPIPPKEGISAAEKLAMLIKSGII